MNRKIDTILGITGWLIGIAIVVHFAMQHGKRWEFNWYGCPVELVAEDGLHYRDGTEIDPFSLMAMKHGPGPAIFLVVYACPVFVIGYTYYVDRLWKQRKREREEFFSQGESPHRTSS